MKLAGRPVAPTARDNDVAWESASAGIYQRIRRTKCTASRPPVACRSAPVRRADRSAAELRPEPIEPGFVDRILPCADAALAGLGFEEVTACGAIAPGRPAVCRDRALRDLTSLILNLCAGRVQTSCPAPAGGSTRASQTLGGMLAEIAAILHQSDCPVASI